MHHKQHYLRLVTLQIILHHLVIVVIVLAVAVVVAIVVCQSISYSPFLTI